MSKIKVQISILRPQVLIKYNLSGKKYANWNYHEHRNEQNKVQTNAFRLQVLIKFTKSHMDWIQTTRKYYMDDWVLDFFVHLIVLKMQKENKNIAIWMIERLIFFLCTWLALKYKIMNLKLPFPQTVKGSPEVVLIWLMLLLILLQLLLFLQLLPMLSIFSFPQTVGDAPGSGPRLGQTAQNQVKLILVISRSSLLRVGLMIWKYLAIKFW